MLFVAAFAVAAICAGTALAGGPVGKTKLVAGGSATSREDEWQPGTTGSFSSEVAGLEVDQDVPNSGTSGARVPSSGVPRPAANAVVGTGSELVKGFQGLNHADQRFSGSGSYVNTNFSLEPPDQALCVGGGQIIEGVNTAFQVYNENGGAVRRSHLVQPVLRTDACDQPHHRRSRRIHE